MLQIMGAKISQQNPNVVNAGRNSGQSQLPSAGKGSRFSPLMKEANQSSEEGENQAVDKGEN